MNLKDRAVFFTTDRGYLVPTIVAALQVLSDEDVRAIADVLVFLVGFSQDDEHRIIKEFEASGIKFFSLSSESYALPKDAIYHATHVPRSALARLVVGDVIPSQYDHVVYLDGDIQIVNSILPLVSHTVRPGYILASSEHAYIGEHERGRYADFYRSYLNGIGIEDSYDYFNSGVLAARRESWIKFSRDAIEFIRKNSDKCRYHDQSALNAVCLGRREVMHPRYNFVSWYAELDTIDDISPSIIHFTGGLKPWSSKLSPWRGAFRRHYDNCLALHPMLNEFWTAVDPTVSIKFDRKVRLIRWRARFLMPWRRPIRRGRIRNYLATAKFAF